MSLLNSLKAVDSTTSASTSTSESVEVTISSISAPINGKFGHFRQFTMNGAKYNVDDSRVFNIQVAKPNAKAVLTINQYVNKDGEEKTVVSALSFVLPEASGLFVMR
jgi:hypothetical protein